MSQILKEKDQILKEMVKLSLDKDSLLEWLLQNMKDDTMARVYITDCYTLIGIDKEANKNGET